MRQRIEVYFDPDFGAVAAVRDESGEIIATGSSHYENGVYTATDEATVFAASGQLIPIPPELWDNCVD